MSAPLFMAQAAFRQRLREIRACPVCGCQLSTFTEADDVVCLSCGWTEADE